MDNFRKPIENRDEVRPDWKIPPTQAIEKDKKEENSFPSQERVNKHPFYMLVFIVINNFFKNFAGKKPAIFPASQKEKLCEDLLSFRKLLHILSSEDQSHNPEFSWHLAQLWHNLLNDSQNIAHVPGLYLKIKNFINEIQCYPKHRDYSLGYYLSEHGDGAWIPFPFLEILHNLHKEHKQNPEDSTLSQWMHALTVLISIIENKETIVTE